MKKTNINQQFGAVSMITVIFLALLLSIITISFIRLSITEQRQAVDDDLTTRAFYAAESGVEDAKSAIALFLDGNMTEQELSKDTCYPANNDLMNITIDGATGYATLSTDLDAAYTCQMIKLDPPDFQAELGEWDSVTIPLDSNNPYDRLIIEWHNIQEDGDAVAHGDTTRLETKTAWSTYPAMLRAGIFSTPSGPLSRSGIASKLVFLNPGGTTSLAQATHNLSSASIEGSPLRSKCDNTGYKCKAIIYNISSARKNYLRLMSLYRGTHIKISLSDAAGNIANIKNVQAIVDVTGKAGDVYRRIEARVSLLEDGYPLPDFALWSNDEICKNFAITKTSTDFTSIGDKCNWVPN